MSLRAVLHLAWRWDRDVLIKIGQPANIQPERMAREVTTARRGNGWMCLAVHHPCPAVRLDEIHREE